ncbi:MAG: Uma2 family endonuclease [Leptospiraceae bacterium]|nr:Uma2 family endonuclease [Leptospiraceae bacterium]
MQIATKPKTYEEYYAETPEAGKFQLIAGEIIEMASPVPYHQSILQKLNFKISSYVYSKNIGEIYPSPMDVTLTEYDTVQPDLIFISKENLSIVKEKRIIGAPDLLVEVLSPTTAYYDLKYKKNLYLKSGVKEYWIIDPEDKSIEVYQNKTNEYKLTSHTIGSGNVESLLLTGLVFDSKELF